MSMFTMEQFQEKLRYQSAARLDLDRAQLRVDKLYSELTITALSTPLFPDKKGSSIKLRASNDNERKSAVEYVIAHDEKLIQAVQELNDAKRDYAEVTQWLKCAQLLMRYETAKLNAGAK